LQEQKRETVSNARSSKNLVKMGLDPNFGGPKPLQIRRAIISMSVWSCTCVWQRFEKQKTGSQTAERLVD